MQWKCLLVAVFAGFAVATAGRGDPAVSTRDGSFDPAMTACKALDGADGADGELRQLAALCRFAASYRRSLPNFLCRQQTIRKSGEGKRDDVVSATVTYERGREQYSDIRINGEPTGRSMRQIDGLTSWGEFGNLFVMLFDTPAATEFQFVRQDVGRGVPVNVFRFHVAREKNVTWVLRYGHREELPEYRGELLLSRATGQLMQIDIEALGLDQAFGLESFRTSEQFDRLPIGTAAYVLPMHSSSSACLRTKPGKAPLCKSNLLELSGCQKFGSESKVLNAMPLQ